MINIYLTFHSDSIGNEHFTLTRNRNALPKSLQYDWYGLCNIFTTFYLGIKENMLCVYVLETDI